MSAPPEPPPQLSVPPLSAAIQRGAEALARPITRLARVGAPRIGAPGPTIESRVRELSSLDLDPDHLTRLQTGAAPRAMERPQLTEAQLGRVTAQFFLRDTHRPTRIADPDHLEREWAVLRDEGWRADLQEVRRAGERRQLDLPALGGRATLEELLADRHAVMVEARWAERFGRPDPSEDG